MTRNLRVVHRLVEEDGLGVVEAAQTVGWSKATDYRHRKASSGELS